MYIIYCEHIFVDILQIYLTDSSFVTEVFPHERPPPTDWSTLSQLLQRDALQMKRDFYWFALKVESAAVPQHDQPLWWHHQPAEGAGEHVQVLTGYLWNRLRRGTNQVATVRVSQLPADARSLRRTWDESRIRDCEAVDASVNWREDAAESQIQHPHGVLFLFNSLALTWRRSHPAYWCKRWLWDSFIEKTVVTFKSFPKEGSWSPRSVRNWWLWRHCCIGSPSVMHFNQNSFSREGEEKRRDRYASYASKQCLCSSSQYQKRETSSAAQAENLVSTWAFPEWLKRFFFKY